MWVNRIRLAAARVGVLLFVAQILFACASPSAPALSGEGTGLKTPAAAAAPTSAPGSSPTSAVVKPTVTLDVTPPPTAITLPATPGADAYPLRALPTPPGTAYPLYAPTPSGVAYPSPAPPGTAVAYPSVGPTRTTVTTEVAAFTVNQIAATAIASAAGEQCLASGPVPAKGFIGNPDRGKMLFVDRGCSACHGDQAQGLVGPKLAGTILSFGEVIQQLRQPRGVMQRYLPRDQSDADECDVYQYVKNLKS